MAITLTEKAAAEIQRVREEQSLEEEMFLRIGVAGGGCSGFNYTMGFDKTFDEKSDSQYEFHGVKSWSTRRVHCTWMVPRSTGTTGWNDAVSRLTIRTPSRRAAAAVRSRPS